MRARLERLTPVILLVIIMLLVALTASAVLANNASAPDADGAVSINTITLRITVQRFIISSWINQNTNDRFSITGSLIKPDWDISSLAPWIGMVRSNIKGEKCLLCGFSPSVQRNTGSHFRV